MKYNLPDRVFRELSALARKYSITKIILLGSRARGTNTERSDIDIAVYGGNFEDFYWDVKEKINSLLIFDIIQADSQISDELKKEIKKDGVVIYEKLDNFSNCLSILKNADFKLAETNDIYRTGIIGQFNLSFELAWKALQEIMRLHGVQGSDTGSPREILQLAYKVGFINDSSVWLLMLKKRNTSVHIYNEAEIDEMIMLIRDSFLPAFTDLEKTLQCKLAEAESDWD